MIVFSDLAIFHPLIYFAPNFTGIYFRSVGSSGGPRSPRPFSIPGSQVAQQGAQLFLGRKKRFSSIPVMI